MGKKVYYIVFLFSVVFIFCLCSCSTVPKSMDVNAVKSYLKLKYNKDFSVEIVREACNSLLGSEVIYDYYCEDENGIGFKIDLPDKQGNYHDNYLDILYRDDIEKLDKELDKITDKITSLYDNLKVSIIKPENYLSIDGFDIDSAIDKIRNNGTLDIYFYGESHFNEFTIKGEVKIIAKDSKFNNVVFHFIYDDSKLGYEHYVIVNYKSKLFTINKVDKRDKENEKSDNKK